MHIAGFPSERAAQHHIAALGRDSAELHRAAEALGKIAHRMLHPATGAALDHAAVAAAIETLDAAAAANDAEIERIGGLIDAACDAAWADQRAAAVVALSAAIRANDDEIERIADLAGG